MTGTDIPTYMPAYPNKVPNLIEYDSFQRCAALLDYIEKEQCQRDDETLTGGFERLDALGRYFWREVARWWSVMDAIEHENMAMFFEQFHHCWLPDCMDPENRRAWSRLPRKKQITIYRGQDLSLPIGLAWTTDRKQAAWFAKTGLRGYRKMEPAILSAKVWKDDVALCLRDRNESEIVPFAIPTDYTIERLGDLQTLAA